MASSTLVDFDVSAGNKVIEALTSDGVDVSVALWAKLEDYDEWRLILAAEEFDKGSPLDAYTRTALAIQGSFVFSAPTIIILRLSDPFIEGLKKVFSQTGDTYGMRLGGQTFGHRFVEDAFVYRIK